MDIHNQKGDVLLTLEAETLEGHDFYRAKLPDVHFENSNLSHSRFYGADLKAANFKNATLKKADLQVADLEGANLQGADLTYANLLSTNLSNADLSNANLKWAVIKGTRYNHNTKFPKGFKPADHEMVLLN